MERTSSWKTCQKAQPSVEENGLLNGYDDDDDDDDTCLSYLRLVKLCFYCCATADILQQCFLFFIGAVIPRQ